MSRSPERSKGEGSVSMGREILRCAQDDSTRVDCYNSSSRPGWGRHSSFGTPCYTIYKSKISPACLIPSHLTTNRGSQSTLLVPIPIRNNLLFLLILPLRKGFYYET